MIIHNRAFTLIELLVVIAIIAILAAILFPVFAQAKVAAKKTVSVSNIKEITTAQFLYLGDYDDTVAMNRNCTLTVNGVGGQLPCVTGAAELGWIDLVVPYVKNYGVFKSPNDPIPANPLPPGAVDFNGNPVTNGIIWQARPNGELYGGEYRSSYGRNNNFANNGLYTANMSQASSPATLILVFSFAANSGGGDNANEGVPGSPFTIVRRPTVTPAPGTCRSYDPTSTGNFQSNFFGALPTYAQVPEAATPSSEREGGVGIYGFADGHAKAYHPDQIAGECAYATQVDMPNNGTYPDFRF